MLNILELPPEILHKILVFAILARHPYSIRRGLRLRLVCKTVCAAFQAAIFESRVLYSTIRNMFALAPTRRWCWSAVYKGEDEVPDPEVNLLSTAAYLSYRALARSLLSEGVCPASAEGLFLSPMHLAALSGNVDMLKMFQEHLPAYE
ncbi:hypothetical protein B0T14DRAFT_570369 [Immersiella caudata]|uniref:Uncharacterized protein n=1 Tax=Immersiella caudata TaxID=314043 RepID=A0AA40BUT3_9PEZI|nr:hypothetical protein B0T14DRAFT_570369 [Immersiella caudata]